MEVITIESQAYKKIIDQLDAIMSFVKKHSEIDDEAWVESLDVRTYLKVSPRTLQRLRSEGLMNYSIIRGRTYYKMSEIVRMLDEHLIKSTPEDFQALVKNYKKQI